ncbi:MAG: UDP-N-acetylmuramoyl-tripeptide--D-alanyl-D-alanine ligase [Bryobacteraceae bacterium]
MLQCSTDSRSLSPGALFFALKGPIHDGHEHAGEAFQRGAVAAVVSRPLELDGLQLLVDDTLAALQRLAAAARARWGRESPRHVVGVTGSAGKTITKDAIAAVLATAYPTSKTRGNFNNHIGVPLSVLNLDDEARAAVIEIGMNHAGEIRELASIAQPQIGVVTNVGTAHIESFDSIEAIALAKRELIEALPADGIAVLNADDARVRRFAEIHPGRAIFFGTSMAHAASSGDVMAAGVEWRADGCDFTLQGAGRFHCPLPARGGLMAALAALATARALGLDVASLKDAVAHLEAPQMRLQWMERGGVVIWDDCYNSNPEAACMMLDLLAVTSAARRIAVLGEMLELGKFSEELHRSVGRHAVQCEVSVLVGIRGAARHLVDEARGAGLTAGAAYFFDEPAPAGQFLKTIARRGDCILFKGSRGTHVEVALEEFLR